MKMMKYADEIVKELQSSVAQISEEETERLVNTLRHSGKVFLAGAGRTGLMGRAFAMRLMHMGIEAYVVGETITPGIGKEDTLIIGSGSGETKSLVSMAQKAKSAEASVVAVTINPASTIGSLADFCVRLPGSSKDRTTGSDVTIQPMGSLFEQTLLLFYDAVILRLMETTGLDTAQMFGRHANLE